MFLNLNPLLISKFDLIWISNSDLQLVGVLIAEYNLSNDRIRNSDQRKSCNHLYFLLDHLESSDLSSVAKVMIKILKYIQPESESKLLHLIH